MSPFFFRTPNSLQVKNTSNFRRTNCRGQLWHVPWSCYCIPSYHKASNKQDEHYSCTAVYHNILVLSLLFVSDQSKDPTKTFSLLSWMCEFSKKTAAQGYWEWCSSRIPMGDLIEFWIVFFEETLLLDVQHICCQKTQTDSARWADISGLPLASTCSGESGFCIYHVSVSSC
jgi:hypothetical protein